MANNDSYMIQLKILSESMAEIAELLKEAVTISIPTYHQATLDSIYAFTESFREVYSDHILLTQDLSKTVSAMFKETLEPVMLELSYQFTNSFKDALQSDVFDGITYEGDCVVIDDETYDAVEKVVESAGETLPPSVRTRHNKMTLFAFYQFFLLPLLPVICNIMYSEFNRNREALEAQKLTLSEATYQESLVQIENDYTQRIDALSESVESIMEYLESQQGNQEALADSHPEPESAASSDDESANHDATPDID